MNHQRHLFLFATLSAFILSAVTTACAQKEPEQPIVQAPAPPAAAPQVLVAPPPPPPIAPQALPPPAPPVPQAMVPPAVPPVDPLAAAPVPPAPAPVSAPLPGAPLTAMPPSPAAPLAATAPAAAPGAVPPAPPALMAAAPAVPAPGAPIPAVPVASAPAPAVPGAPVPPAPSATAPAPFLGVLAKADGETPGTRAEVTELKRGSGGIVMLKLSLFNDSDKAMSFNYNFVSEEFSTGDFNTIGGVHLIDNVGKKKYLVVRDASHSCVCSKGMKDLAPKSSVNVWAKFPAPPDNVEKISIVIPHFSPIDDVTISR